MRVALVSAPLQSAICDLALGHQIPLGLLMIAGPLVDHGFEVELLDAAREHWTDAQIVARLSVYRPDIVMVGHSASTKSHPSCVKLLGRVKAALPGTVTVYGGVHPRYHCREILASQPEVDVIVCGEGEDVAIDLVTTLSEESRTWNAQCHASGEADLSRVAGVAWRSRGQVIVNAPRPPIRDLERCRIGWELIRDWDKYQAFGLGRTAVVQFSRGCPHRCTYCGQWPFWGAWRHRDVTRFVDEMELLHRNHGVRFFWFADENPTTDKAVWRRLLEEIVRRRLAVRMTASIRAQDIVRDADILDVYHRAGFVYVLMGVESVSDETLRKAHKGSSVDDACQAVRLLRASGILSIIDYIFGLEDETARSVWRALRGLHRYDSDFVNVLHFTPYTWTQADHDRKNRAIIESDLWKWDYRHQVVAVSGLSRAQMFLAAKLVELLYHVHPRRLWRAAGTSCAELRRQYRFAYRRGARVLFHEILDYFGISFRRTGGLASRGGASH